MDYGIGERRDADLQGTLDLRRRQAAATGPRGLPGQVRESNRLEQGLGQPERLADGLPHLEAVPAILGADVEGPVRIAAQEVEGDAGHVRGVGRRDPLVGEELDRLAPPKLL